MSASRKRLGYPSERIEELNSKLISSQSSLVWPPVFSPWANSVEANKPIAPTAANFFISCNSPPKLSLVCARRMLRIRPARLVAAPSLDSYLNRHLPQDTPEVRFNYHKSRALVSSTACCSVHMGRQK